MESFFMLTNEHTAKVMILYALKCAGGPLPTEVLSQILSQCGFGVIGAMSELDTLTVNRHVSVLDDDGVSYAVLTKTGEDICETFSSELGTSMREKIMLTTAREVASLRKDLGVSSKTEQTENGYKVSVNLSDDEIPLMRLEMFAPTKAQADIMIGNFRDDPYAVYRAVLASMTNQRK